METQPLDQQKTTQNNSTHLNNPREVNRQEQQSVGPWSSDAFVLRMVSVLFELVPHADGMELVASRQAGENFIVWPWVKTHARFQGTGPNPTTKIGSEMGGDLPQNSEIGFDPYFTNLK